MITDQLIVALDVNTGEEAKTLVNDLGDSISFYKVGWQLFANAGMKIVNWLTDQNKKVFLDLKLDDTPRTVEQAVQNLKMSNVEFFTLQGNGDTISAARTGRGDNIFPKFLQVTSLSSRDLSDLYNVKQAEKAITSQCDGVIASGTSVRRIRNVFPNLMIVSPGIRLNDETNDHKRTLTPYDAIISGADYLVVGRPIYTSNNRSEVISHIHHQINRASFEKSISKIA